MHPSDMQCAALLPVTGTCLAFNHLNDIRYAVIEVLLCNPSKAII
jgi:hypothetical protein